MSQTGSNNMKHSGLNSEAYQSNNDGGSVSNVSKKSHQFGSNISQSEMRKSVRMHKAMLKAREIKEMDPRQSVQTYPRIDEKFRKKHSFNFDMMKSKIFIDRVEPFSISIWRWVVYFFIGFFTGLLAFLMSWVEDKLIEYRDEILETIFHSTDDNLLYGWMFMFGWCWTLAIIGSILTIYVGPGSTGSGIAEIIAILNGVNYPGFISWGVLFCKSVCVILAICASLCVGKEGPLAHIGACVAYLVIYKFPFPQFAYFKNEVSKREFLAGGASAGVSAAFGAPIGGALFSYELSRPATFWTFSMLWRIFFCCSISTFTLSFLSQVKENGWSDLELTSAGTLKFGNLQNTVVSLSNIHGALSLGVLGGMLGSLFINVNTRMGRCRKRYITTKARKILETGLFAGLTISVSYLCTAQLNKCATRSTYVAEDLSKASVEEEIHNQNAWTCPDKEHQFSPIASLFFNTEKGIIKSLFTADDHNKFETINLFVFGLVWFVFTITTYGVWIPAGLFLPGIIMGGALGRLYTNIVQSLFNYQSNGEAEQNALLGAAAMLSGYCRLTYSLTVLMLETTQSVNLFIPMLITMVVSYGVAMIFNQSLYARALRTKQVPFLKHHMPEENLNLVGRVIMKPNPTTLTSVPTVKDVYDALSLGYKSYPITNLSGQLVGNISANFLIVILQNQSWYQGTGGPESPTRGLELEGEASHSNRINPSAGISADDDQLNVQNDVERLLSKKQSTVEGRMKSQISNDEQNLMRRVSRLERNASEYDIQGLPMEQSAVLHWTHFNSDMVASELNYESVTEIVNSNKTKRVDLRHYMIESPYVCFTTDKVQKILDIFRFMQLRQMCVINPIDGKLKGVISREDLFAYMKL